MPRRATSGEVVTTARLVCLGDSFTEGMCDDLRPDGQYRGWADRVAEALAARARRSGDVVEYADLAVRGKLLDEVVAEQLDPALSFAPTVLTFHAGPNDVLRRGTDLPDLARRYDDAVRRLAAGGGQVVLFTSIGRAGGDGRVARLLAQRFAEFNATVRGTARRHRALVVDLEPIEVLTDRRLWHPDRLHLNADGHERVAAAVLETLGLDLHSGGEVGSDNDAGRTDRPAGWWRAPLPPRPAGSRYEDLTADALWVRDHLLPWVGRRIRGVSSGDGRAPKDGSPRVLTGP